MAIIDKIEVGGVTYNIVGDVTQTVTSTSATYNILFSNTAGLTNTVEDSTRHSQTLFYNPGTNKLTIGGSTAGGALIVGTSTTAGMAGWTTTVPNSTTNAVTGQVMFVI